MKKTTKIYKDIPAGYPSASTASNQYFKRRRGEIVLPPEEQGVIQVALEKAGITHPMEFDEYIEAINWIS